MFSLTDSNHYYLCPQGVDMRKGFDSLCGVVRQNMNKNPLMGDVFIFISKSRRVIKLLHMEQGGLVIYHKRLEKGTFEMPIFNPQDKSYYIKWCDLVMMIEGISGEIKRKKRWEISDFLS